MSTITANRSTHSHASRSWVLWILFLIYMLNYVDRALLNVVGQAVKQDLGLSDLQLGLAAGLAFALVNGVMTIPIARLAEHHNRVTIIAGALAVWSVMTALCGAVQSFWQLVLFRAGVGIGEAGGVAPSQSLLADYFPAERRASALALFGAATPTGMLLGALASGWVTDHFSWRAAFVVIGAPGVLVAIVAALTLKDAPRGFADGAHLQADVPRFSAVIATLKRQPAFIHMLLGCTLLNLGFFGFITFLHPFLVRSMHMTYTDAALYYGLVTGLSCGVGYVLGGFLAERLGQNDRRWYLWVPALGAVVAAPAFALAFLQSNLSATTACLFIGGVGATLWYGPNSAMVHSLVEPRMRTTAIAIFTFIVLVFGVALGPALVGFLSDAIKSRLLHGACAPALDRLCEHPDAGGVRLALLAVSPLYVWAAAHYTFAARRLATARPAIGS